MKKTTIVTIAALSIIGVIGFQNCSGGMQLPSGVVGQGSSAGTDGSIVSTNPPSNGLSQSPAVEILDQSINPGELATITIKLNTPAARNMAFTAECVDDSAIAGQHYVTLSVTGVIGAASTSAQFQVQTTSSLNYVYIGKSFVVRVKLPDLSIDQNVRVTFKGNPASVALSNRWTSIAAAPAGNERHMHTAVWTGSKMLVWGGNNAAGSSGLNGLSYDPAADSWSTFTGANAPARLSGSSGVWTGSKMIIWGGYATGAYSDAGSIFDPAASSWSSMTASGAPSPRYGHTAVWTGSKMIVWGGCVRDGASNLVGLNDGAVYDLNANAWTAITVTGAPAGRCFHSAVWTGSKMLIWGEPLGASTMDGALYDPATNTWTPISIPGGSAGAINTQTTAWTGSQMIVWGGYRLSTANGGWVYDVATNSLSATSTTGAPAGRINATAIWTGSKMIVWGGYNNPTGWLGDGGIFY